MAIATFLCKDCNISKQVVFSPGKLDKPICEKCGKEMQREWKKIDTGTVVEESVLYATEIMQNAGMVTKDKLVY
jgi:hypothetical protein